MLSMNAGTMFACSIKWVGVGKAGVAVHGPYTGGGAAVVNNESREEDRKRRRRRRGKKKEVWA